MAKINPINDRKFFPFTDDMFKRLVAIESEMNEKIPMELIFKEFDSTISEIINILEKRRKDKISIKITKID
jgi:hypothetical protein